MSLVGLLDRKRQIEPGDEFSAGRLRSDVLRLGVPAAGEQVLGFTVNVVNTILVGHLGAAALAAVGLSGSISLIASTFFTAVATGTTALVAQAIGAGNQRMACRVLDQSMLLGIVLGLLACATLYPLARPSLVLMGADAATAGLGKDYLCWLAFSQPFSALLLVGGGAMRGAGDTRTPMLIMGGVNAANLVLSWVLVRGLGPIAALGVAGAGIAATAATALGCLAVLVLLLRGHGPLILNRRRTRLLDREVLASIVHIGLPAGGEVLLFRLAFLAYTRAISSLGTVAYAAYLIAQRVEALCDMPASGFAVAATTLSGQALGAGRPALARRYVFKSIEMTLIFSLSCGLLCWVLPETLLSLFTDEAAVVAQGIVPLRIVAVGLPAVAFALGFSGGLRGAGETRPVMVATGIGSWAVRVPLSFLSVTWLGLGLAGIQSAMVLDYVARALLLAWRLRGPVWMRHVQAAIPRESAAH